MISETALCLACEDPGDFGQDNKKINKYVYGCDLLSKDFQLQHTTAGAFFGHSNQLGKVMSKGKKRSLKDVEIDNNGDKTDNDDVEYKYATHLVRKKRLLHALHEAPDVVIRQRDLEKSHLSAVFRHLPDFRFVASNSNRILPLGNQVDCLNLGMPVLLFFFDCSTTSLFGLFNTLPQMKVAVFGITPYFKSHNDNCFPIVLDNHGSLSKQLGIRNPVGGGVYPIPSIFLFDRNQNEVLRIKLGYDYNVFYNSSPEKNLQKVLLEAVEYVS